MKYAYIKTLLRFGVQLTATDVLQVDGLLTEGFPRYLILK